MGYCMAQAAEMSLACTYVCDSDMLMALAVMRVRQAAVRTAKALAGVKCMSRTPEITKARWTWWLARAAVIPLIELSYAGNTSKNQQRARSEPQL